MMTALERLLDGMIRGREWALMDQSPGVRALLMEVYDERFNSRKHYKDGFRIRTNLQKKEDSASYAGWITANNPDSGPFEGTCFAWFPATKGGSVAVLVIGTNGFGSDAHILGRPGHARRLRALSHLHRGKIWVKPDVLDRVTQVPHPITDKWPAIPAAISSYSSVIYAAVAVQTDADREAVEDLIDLFFHEHNVPLVGSAKARWEERLERVAGAIFPSVDERQILDLLEERRFVILEGPPGTGKTRAAFRVAERIGSSTRIQFHAARTYEDFVVGLFPRPTESGLMFDVRAGDLLLANHEAEMRPHVLVIDEINRTDLARVLGEAVVLFETGERGRTVRLPHKPAQYSEDFRLSENLLVLGTRNTADRTIARMDIAIRRRFAFLEMWPDMQAVRDEEVHLAVTCFADVINTFTEYGDRETLRLTPGHAYFLDPRPDLDAGQRENRVRRRIRYELIPLLRDYIEERLCGEASEAISGLADRVEARLLDA